MLRVVLVALLASVVVARLHQLPIHIRSDVKMIHTDAKEFVADEYVAVLAAHTSADQHSAVASTVNGTVLAIGNNFKAIHFSTHGDDMVLVNLLANPRVATIEPNQIMHAVGDLCDMQAPPLSWGQDRTTAASANDLNDFLLYQPTDGSGVDAYIIDTGILLTHNEFGGRAIFGINTASGSNTDVNGHGTHVASTVAGATYGFAKQATLIAVKVLGDNGSGTIAGIIEGIQFVTKRQGSTGKPSLGNMSLGGGASSSLDQAVNAAVDAGLTLVVAAGNDNKDACNYSPARAAKAVTTGSTELVSGNSGPDSQADRRSTFSNYGSCVDIMAPGTAITGAWCTSNTALKTISGTSMASPHVCGIAAVYLGHFPKATPAQVQTYLADTGLRGQIEMGCANSACNLTPNLMLHRPC